MTVLESGWSGTTSATITLGGTWLKSSTDPSMNAEVCLAGPTLEGKQGAPLSVFRVQDRRDPIVHQGSVQAETFSVTFAFNTDAEWADFVALRELAEPLLLQTPYGDGAAEQFWLRLGDAQTTRYTSDDMGDAQVRVVTVDAVEVGVP